MHSWFYFPNITIKTAIITNFAVKFSKFIKTFLPKKTNQTIIKWP
ncbi:hypothetical protein E9G_08666 [Moraxella catarrhalis 7169]|nr:hypothetical protein E9G_08666 [Moraxella catarrhalis 7169]